jgi:hypothetical protein
MRHIINRNKLYEEEVMTCTIFPQRVMVLVDHAYPKANIYEVSYQGKCLVEGDIIQKNASQRSELIHVPFYGVTDDVALSLAHRWIEEENQKKKGYRVIGIDQDYSIFD